MKKPKRLVAVIGICIAGFLAIATTEALTGYYQTESYIYACEVCEQRWSKRTTYKWGVPVWQSGSQHTATDHPPTYQGGGYTHETWSFLLPRRSIACGRHSISNP